MDVHNKAVRSYNMSRIRSTDTKPEIAVRQFLFSKGFRFRKNDRRYPGHPDIVLPKYRTIIFINGCFWHAHEECSDFSFPKSNTDFWKKKLLQNRKRDAEIYRELTNLGWKVIVIWQCELKKSLFQERMNKLTEQIVR